MPGPLHVAFLGCGFITDVHSRQLRALGPQVVATRYASRDLARAEAYRKRFGGVATYGDYLAAIADPAVDAVVIAVPPRLSPRPDAAGARRRQARAGREAGLPDDGRLPDGAWRRATAPAASCWSARTITTSRSPSRLRTLLADGAIGEMVFAHFTTHRASAEDAPTTGATTRRWPAATRSSRKAFTGCTWPAASARRSSSAHGFRPSVSREGPDRRAKSMMVAFQYDNGAVGSLYYSREIPSLLKGLRAVEAVRPRGHHHLRVERRLRAGPRPQGTAPAVPGLPRHPRLPGDVSRLRPRHPRRRARRR